MITIPGKKLNSSIWPKDGTLTSTPTLGQSELESNGNERLLVWFYGISILVGYLLPNPVYTYMIYKQIFHFYRYINKNKWEDLLTAFNL